MAKPIEDYREDRFLGKAEFCALLEITPVTYYKILRGVRPSYPTMRKIAAKLGVSPADITEFLPNKQSDTGTQD